jgi:transcriptional regulator GlxA family with amidase domain
MPDPRANRRFTVALVGAPAVLAGPLYGFLDLLASVRVNWEVFHGQMPGESPFRPLVVSRDRGPFMVPNGVQVLPNATFEECPKPDIVCITDLAEAPGTDMTVRYKEEIDWIRQAWRSGATVCSACSGALLLAATGLLEGEEATSHWAYCDQLEIDYPNTRWSAERTLVLTGPGSRLMMAGSGAAWYMLTLAVIARFASPQQAMQVARCHLLSSDDVSAVAYASLTRGPRATDPVVSRCQVWAATNYHNDAPVTRLVALSGLPERTFKRRFTEVTGMSPLEYIHRLRLEEAKQLLESTDLPVEAIASEVGYQDASFFNRLFRRKVDLTPASYRRRFGALSQQLHQIAMQPEQLAA